MADSPSDDKLPPAVLRAKEFARKRWGKDGLRTRWGDGDGSFWDRFVVSTVRARPGRTLPKGKHDLDVGFRRPRAGWKRHRLPVLSPAQLRASEGGSRLGAWMRPETAASYERLAHEAPTLLRSRLESAQSRISDSISQEGRANELLLRKWKAPALPGRANGRPVTASEALKMRREFEGNLENSTGRRHGPRPGTDPGGVDKRQKIEDEEEEKKSFVGEDREEAMQDVMRRKWEMFEAYQRVTMDAPRKRIVVFDGEDRRSNYVPESTEPKKKSVPSSEASRRKLLATLARERGKDNEEPSPKEIPPKTESQEKSESLDFLVVGRVLGLLSRWRKKGQHPARVMRRKTLREVRQMNSAQVEEGDKSTTLRESADAYAQVCEELGIAPDPILSHLEHTYGGRAEAETGMRHVTKLRIPNYGIGATRGVALAAALAVDHPTLEELDVSGNRLGHDTANDIAEAAATLPRLRYLNLSDNGAIFRDGRMPWGIADALAVSRSLREVRLANCGIGGHPRVVAATMQALVDCPRLQILDISRNNLSEAGSGVEVARLISDLGALQELDISWNSISEADTIPIGAALVVSNTLVKLHASWNAWGREGTIAAGQAIREAEALEVLDISHSGVDPSAALVLARGASVAPKLRELILDGSLLGLEGTRAIVGAAVRKRPAIVLSLRGCNMELQDARLSELTGGQRGDTSGQYRLNLSDPVENAVAHEHLRIFAESPMASIKSFVIKPKGGGGGQAIRVGRRVLDAEGGVASSAVESSDRAALVAWNEETNKQLALPSEGELAFEIESHGLDAAEALNAAPAHALESLIKLLSRSNMEEHERLFLVRIASDAMHFTPTQAAEIVGEVVRQHEDRYGIGVSARAARLRAMVTSALLPSVVGGTHTDLFLSVNLDPSERRSVEERMGQLARYVPSNPTGRYVIDLSSQNDRELLRRLLATNTREIHEMRHAGRRHDLSQLGTWDNFRNATFNDAPFRLTSKYVIPRVNPSGILSFDYVSTTLPSKDAPVVTDADVVRIIRGVCLLLGRNPEKHLFSYANKLHFLREAISRRRSTQAALQSSPSAKSPRSPSAYSMQAAQRTVQELESMEESADALATALAPDGGSKSNLGWIWTVPGVPDASSSARPGSRESSRSMTRAKSMAAPSSHESVDSPRSRAESIHNNEFAEPRVLTKLGMTELPNVPTDEESVPTTAETYLGHLPKGAFGIESVPVEEDGSSDGNHSDTDKDDDDEEEDDEDKIDEKLHGTERATSADESTQVAAMRKAGLTAKEATGALTRAHTLRTLKDAVPAMGRSFKFSTKLLQKSTAAKKSVRITEPEMSYSQEKAQQATPEKATPEKPTPKKSVPSDISLPFPLEKGASSFLRNITGTTSPRSPSPYRAGKPRLRRSRSMVLRPAAQSSSPEPSSPFYTESPTQGQLANALVYLRRATSQLYIPTKFAIDILRAFPEDESGGRVEAMIVLFSRLLDIRDVWPKIIPTLEHAENRYIVCRRLGWLNVFNPNYPDTDYDLDLAIYDERVLAEMIVILSVAEPGVNCLNETFNNIPGWELPASWAKEVPRAGRFFCTYTTTGPGCVPIWEVRAKLENRTLLGSSPFRTNATPKSPEELPKPRIQRRTLRSMSSIGSTGLPDPSGTSESSSPRIL